MRPDGSERRALTDTREFNEAGLRFSPDGKRLLYYRLPKVRGGQHGTYGTHELVIADADGNPEVYGTEFPGRPGDRTPRSPASSQRGYR